VQRRGAQLVPEVFRRAGSAMEVAEGLLSRAQEILDLSFFHSSQFRTSKSLGKIGVGGFLLGIFFGCSIATLIFSLLLVATLSSPPVYIYTLVV
jgi:hypothetical protein